MGGWTPQPTIPGTIRDTSSAHPGMPSTTRPHTSAISMRAIMKAMPITAKGRGAITATGIM